jgi:hypothetical protein
MNAYKICNNWHLANGIRCNSVTWNPIGSCRMAGSYRILWDPASDMWTWEGPQVCSWYFSWNYVGLTTSSALISSMKQLTAEAAAIRNCSQNIFSLLDVKLYTFYKISYLFLETYYLMVDITEMYAVKEHC